MKRQIALFLLAAASTIAPSKADNLMEKYKQFLVTPHGYVCYRTSAPLTIDGKLNEADWAQAPATESFVDISGEGFPTPTWDTKAKMLWDDDYLYIAATLEEPNIIANLTQRDTIIYHDNDFEVFLDPDGDTHNYFEIENNARGVIFDLMLDKPYRNGGDFMIQWDCPGLKLEVFLNGTMNNPKDKDRLWTVEMAIPREAVRMSFGNTLKAGNYWRINFSRVQWPENRVGKHEDNWVWVPTGKVDMHLPERWGYLYFSKYEVGKGRERFSYPYDMNAYKLIWSMFYAQRDYLAANGKFMTNVDQFKLTKAETSKMPNGYNIDLQATSRQFSIVLTAAGKTYTINEEGVFRFHDGKGKKK